MIYMQIIPRLWYEWYINTRCEQDADLGRQSRWYKKKISGRRRPCTVVLSRAEIQTTPHTRRMICRDKYSLVYPVELVPKTTRKQTKRKPVAQYFFNVHQDNRKIWFARRYLVLAPAKAQTRCKSVFTHTHAFQTNTARRSCDRLPDGRWLWPGWLFALAFRVFLIPSR
jgi:hypothetical protein